MRTLIARLVPAILRHLQAYADVAGEDARDAVAFLVQRLVALAIAVVAVFYLGEKIRWNHLAAFACILAAVAFTFLPRE